MRFFRPSRLPSARIFWAALSAAFVTVPACNSPKATQQPASLGGLPRTLQAAGVRGIIGGVIKTPFSAGLRGAHQTAATVTALVNPGMRGVSSLKGPPPPVSQVPDMEITRFEADLDRRLKPVKSRGTVKLLVDGPDYFSALTSALRQAREPVDVQMYIFDTDDVGVKMADELKAVSKRVPVRVVFDDLGTVQASNIAAPSAARIPKDFQPPADILAYLKQDSNIDARRLSNVFLTSTHTKIITIGTSCAFTGGMNIGREYRYDWRDLMAELHGPVVGEMKDQFERSFALTRVGGDIDHLWNRSSKAGKGSPRPPIPEPPGSHDIRVLHTRAFDAQIEKAIHLAIAGARRRIWIENPYFADDRIVRELIEARHRGVDVRIIMPATAKADGKIMAANNATTAALMLQHGIRIFHYPRMTHVKAAVFDGWAFIGSANYDHLSLRLNEEINIAYSDPGAVRNLELQLFLPGFRDSREQSVDTVKPTVKDLIAESVADQL